MWFESSDGSDCSRCIIVFSASKPIMSSTARMYFDESIFESGFALKNYSTVRVYNEADRFLARRLDKVIATDDCTVGDDDDNDDVRSTVSIPSSVLSTSSSSSSSSGDSELCDRINNTIDADQPISEDEDDGEQPNDNRSDNRVININPSFPCRGINIYTLNIINKDVISTLPYNRITVDNSGDFYPIYIGEPTQIGSARFTIGELSSLESALMLKYFAIRGPVAISVELYMLVNRYFVDYRSWFSFSSDLGVLETPTHSLLVEGRPIELYDSIQFYGPPIELL